MKTIKSIFLCLVVLFTTSCESMVLKTTLKKDYSKNVSSFSSKMSLDDVWSKLIDFFSEKGIGIQTLDKSSGLIVSQDYSFRGRITVEDDNSWDTLKGVEFVDKSAWVVCDCDVYYNGLNKTSVIITPTRDLGNFNVRIKQDDGKSKISINLVSFRFEYQSSVSSVYLGTTLINKPYEAHSTGVFEKLLIDYIDKNAIKL
jgi:hypothetical protein